MNGSGRDLPRARKGETTMVDERRLAETIGVDEALVREYRELFETHGIPIHGDSVGEGDRAERLLMVSTHGYWGDPPPAGVPDTGGQTYYVLEVSKAWARQGRKVIIFARWFEPFPRVEQFADGVWLVRLRAGSDEFVRKEEIYALTPALAEAATTVGALFGAEGVMGHYADGMVVAAEIGERLGLPVTCVPHSMGVLKMLRLGWDPDDEAQLRDPEYHFDHREVFELAALRAANFEIANTPREPEILREYYDIAFPHAVMPAGAAKPFFEAGEADPDPSVAARFGLEPGKYVLFWGRLSEAKFVEGVVQVLGEARKLDPDAAGDVVAAIIGGSPDNPSGEEKEVERAVATEMERYGLGPGDVKRIESQTHATLAPLARTAVAYVGMQRLEPFGMGAAEAMGAGLPTMISQVAGITRWLQDGVEVVFIDPDDPATAGAKLVELIRDREHWQRLSRVGREKSIADFSWDGIAARQGRVMDSLLAGEDPREAGELPAVPVERFQRRKGRAFHRTTSPWRGDIPRIKAYHVDAARELLPHILERVDGAGTAGRRLTVALGGESGSGKTEIGYLLSLMLREQGKRGVVIPGDAFFVRPPDENHANRLAAAARGDLSEGVGPHEVNLARLDGILAAAADRGTAAVAVPSDCRSLTARRYPEVPVALDGVDAVMIDLTYSLHLEHADCKIFLQPASLDRIEEVRARNLARDPDQDFDFIERVLRLEHDLISPLIERADLIVDKDYRVEVP